MNRLVSSVVLLALIATVVHGRGYYHGHKQRSCTAAGDRCAGAPGKPFVAYAPCCDSAKVCTEDASLSWGKFCVDKPAASPGKCYQSGERCMGAPGRPYVNWAPCCSSGDKCVEDSSMGWGSFCKASPTTSAPVTTEQATTTPDAPRHGGSYYGYGYYGYGKHMTGAPTTTSMNAGPPMPPTATVTSPMTTFPSGGTQTTTMTTSASPSSTSTEQVTSSASTTTASTEASSTTMASPSTAEPSTTSSGVTSTTQTSSTTIIGTSGIGITTITSAPSTTTTEPTTTTTTTSTTSTSTTTQTSTTTTTTTLSNCFSVPSYVGQCLTAQERELGNLINAYRASLSPPLPAVPITKTLSHVAQFHAYDSVINMPDVAPCNQHSWSDKCSAVWTPVCYLPSHENMAGMHNKPSEFNNNFSGAGFEISTKSTGTITPSSALSGWQRSEPHNNVITENGWGRFNAMGVGMYQGQAHVWFSYSSDPAGAMPDC